MLEIKETMPTAELKRGHKTVGLTEVQVTPQAYTLRKGILIRCPGDSDPTPNTNVVWIGTKGVTADSTGSGGFPLAPGESINIPAVDPSKVYIISDAADQTVAWIGV